LALELKAACYFLLNFGLTSGAAWAYKKTNKTNKTKAKIFQTCMRNRFYSIFFKW